MMVIRTLEVDFQPPPVHYELLIGEDLLHEALAYAKKHSSQSIVIITKAIYELLPPIQEEKFLLPQEESIKSRAMKEKIEDGLIERGFGREACLIAIGGGALIDLVGFVAATYCRGISYLTIPTTLTAMADVAVGGKTAVNVAEAKNWIGAFHHPKKTYIDLSLLKTLPQREFACGLVEIIKHGLVFESSFFDFLENKLDSILERDSQVLQEMIFRSCSIKRKIVEQDPFEGGLRRILNFGHTIGHALETLSGYSCPHGQAVAMGILIEARIAHRIGYLSRSALERIVSLFKRLPLRMEFPPKLPYEMLRRDKKGAHRFVVLTDIGTTASFDGEYVTYLREEILYTAWKDVELMRHH